MFSVDSCVSWKHSMQLLIAALDGSTFQVLRTRTSMDFLFDFLMDQSVPSSSSSLGSFVALPHRMNRV